MNNLVLHFLQERLRYQQGDSPAAIHAYNEMFSGQLWSINLTYISNEKNEKEGNLELNFITSAFHFNLENKVVSSIFSIFRIFYLFW